MSDRSTLFTSGSMQTFVAASFILALLGTGIATYTVARMSQIEDAVIDMRIQQARLMESESQLRLQVADLRAQLDSVEALPRHTHSADEAQ